MNFNFDLFIRAVGLALVFEAICLILFTTQMQEAMKRISLMHPQEVRLMGMIGLTLGTIIIWIATHFS